MPTGQKKTKNGRTHKINPRRTQKKADGYSAFLAIIALVGMIAVGLISLGVITRNVEDGNGKKSPEATERIHVRITPSIP